MARDYYDVLGIPRDATTEQVQQAYRKLARKHHPDVNKDPGAEDRFKEVNEAYTSSRTPRPANATTASVRTSDAFPRTTTSGRLLQQEGSAGSAAPADPPAPASATARAPAPAAGSTSTICSAISSAAQADSDRSPARISRLSWS